jgi:hypothetical protein
MDDALSSAGSRADVTARSPKLDYVGTNKINNQTLQELRYGARAGWDLRACPSSPSTKRSISPVLTPAAIEHAEHLISNCISKWRPVA